MSPTHVVAAVSTSSLVGDHTDQLVVAGGCAHLKIMPKLILVLLDFCLFPALFEHLIQLQCINFSLLMLLLELLKFILNLFIFLLIERFDLLSDLFEA